MAISPITPIPTLQQQPSDIGIGSNQIKQLRAYIDALQKRQSAMPTYTKGAIGMGINDFTKDVVGGLFAKKADEQERALYGRRRDAETPMIGQDQGSDTSAPGGAAPASPFTQDSQAGSQDPL